MKNNQKKLWGNAFDKQPLEDVIKFTAGRDVHSVAPVDYKLLPYDIWGSKVHCVMLCEQKIISKKDARSILKGLSEIQTLAEKKQFNLSPEKEDVHTNVESWLINKYGIESAGKLHTARSRNDQCSVDTRLYLRDQVLTYVTQTVLLATSLIKHANQYKEYLTPGFTHCQHAMVTTLGHILMAFATMIVRDTQRFIHWFNLHNTNPLGNTVAYGTSFPINQQLTTKLLGFDNPDINSMDQITNRWEAESDLAFAITNLMNHLSSLAHFIIILATPEFNMIKLADQFSTGSSIMPHKKNPDPLEVIKGKASLSSGSLQSLLSIGRANFIGFNRDTQWTKYLITDLVDECLLSTKVVEGVIKTMTVNKKQMEYWCHRGFIGATSLLEQLVNKYQLPFRKGKIVVEKAVKFSKGEHKVTFVALTKALKQESINIKVNQKQVSDWQDPQKIISSTKSFGGPGLKSMKKSMQLLKISILKQEKWLKKKKNAKHNALTLLNKKIQIILKESE